MNAVFRLEANSQIGVGHVMRCRALATALIRHGYQCCFAMQQCPTLIADSLAARRIHLHTLSLEDSDAEFEQLLTSQSCDWLVVDGYQFDFTWQQPLLPLVKHWVFIDDLANRAFYAELLLDQTLDRQVLDYQTLNHCPHGRFLCGIDYALLDERILAARSAQTEPTPLAKRIIVSFGASDDGRYSLPVLSALSALPEATDWQFSLAFNHPTVTEQAIAQQLQALGHNVTLYFQHPNMAEIWRSHDVAIGAGGSALIEKAVLGLPSLAFQIAANQQGQLQAYGEKAAIIHLGAFNEQGLMAMTHQVQQLFAQPERWLQLRQNNQQLVDGQGIARIIEHMQIIERGALT